MSAPEKPKKAKKPKLKQGDKSPPPVGPPPLTDTPPPRMHERPHSPAAAVPPGDETKQPTQGRTPPPPLGPPPLEDTPPPTMHERPHSPAAADPPEDETQPFASDYGSTGSIMPKEKTGRDVTPRSGLDLGRQGLEGSGGSEHHEQRVRERAYQIWERKGGTGDPEDHWYSAERELKHAT